MLPKPCILTLNFPTRISFISNNINKILKFFDFFCTLISSFQWLIETISSGVKIKDKFFIVLFYLLKTTTYPLWIIKKFDAYKLFFLSNVTVKNINGLFLCRANSLDIYVCREEHERELRKYFILKEGIFIDIGAHVGKYSIMVGNKLQNRGMVIAIEPESGNYEMIKRNANLNNLQNIKAINIACFSRNQKIKLYLTGDYLGSGTNSVVRKTSKYQVVLAKKLDEILKQFRIMIKDVKIIKIDVEGAELNCLQGAENLLRYGKAKIIFEALNDMTAHNCIAFLEKFGYKVKQLNPTNFLGEK